LETSLRIVASRSHDQTKSWQALRIPLKEDCAAQGQTMLEAHEALIKAVPENLPEFKDIIQYLKEELHLPK